MIRISNQSKLEQIKMFGKIRLVMLLALFGLVVSVNAQWPRPPLPSSGSWSATTINTSTAESYRTVNLTGNVTVDGTITIDGVTLTINSYGGSRVISRGSANSCFFKITNGGRLVINGQSGTETITLDGGAKWRRATTSDGDIYGYIQDCFDGGSSSGVSYPGVRNAVFDSSNGKSSDMALIYSANSSFSLKYVVLENNYATANKGGAIRCCGQKNGQITVENTIIRNCQNKKGGGGAVFFDNDDNSTYDSGRKATFTDCEIYGCADYAETSAAGGAGGGGIRTAGKAYTALTMTRCNIHHCYSSRKGGGILWNVGEQNGESYTMQLENCTFSYNVSKFSGGGVSNEGKMAIEGCSFRHNKALGIPASDDPTRIDGYGGGLYSQTYTYAASDFTSELSVDESTVIESNEAIYGGGIAFMLKSVSTLGDHSYTMNFVINGAKIYGNKATINGGAIYIEKPAGVGENYKGSFVMNSGYIYGNTAEDNGGAIYTEGGISDTINGGFIGQNEIGNPVANTAGRSGGAIYANGGSVTVNNGNVKNNNAMVRGGGIYSSGEITLSGTTSIMNNTAGNSGGGVYVDGDGSIKLGEGSLTVMENHARDHTVKSNIFLPNGKKLTVKSIEFNPRYIGIHAGANTDCFPVIDYASPATTNTLQSIYNGLLNGTCNVFDDKQTYSLAYKEQWGEITLSENHIYFIKTPWGPLQRSTSADDLKPLAAGTYEVNDVKSLTAFLWHVNGISTFSTDEAFRTQHPGAKAKMTADVPMAGYYWVPIGTSAEQPFTGTFDGDGHTISDLTMVAANSSTEYGMFGHVSSGADIKNVMLRDCLFTGTNDYVGSLVYKMHGGTLSNCQAHGIVNTAQSACTAGGLVGYANGGEIHSCFSNVELGGYNMGGLVGKLDSGASLKNSLANAKFQYAGNDASKYIGGLAAINNGTIANCYVREQEGGSHGSATYGTLVGSNSGTVSHCFCKAETTPGNNVGSDSDCGTYSAVFDEGSYHKYRSHDCKASTTGNPLECELNAWVAQTDAAKYAKWNRPTTKDINGDYPLLKMTGSNAAAETTSGNLLHYGNVNTLLAEEGNGAVWFYGAEDSFNPYSGNKLYIDEDAALKQAPSKAGSINATVGITLDNSAGTEGANPTQGGTDAIDWHFFSTSLSNAPLGIAYVNSDGDEDETHYGMYATDLPQYQHTGEGYFPDTDFEGNDYYNEWDFYAYHEPEYQWVNYKRNSNSHWNVDTGNRFDYPNEAVLVPGKGYLVALADPDGTLLQCAGKLNDGEITLPLTCGGPHRRGFNLLGNPYQSYLDFEEFAKKNSQTIWNTTIPSDYSREDPDLTRPGYIIMDEDQKGYIFYAYGASANGYTAPRYLHPHQGFIVVTQSAGNAVFNNRMREVNANGSTFRSEPQADYPLVDLLCYDEDGNRDLTVVELGRPDKGGMVKVDGLSKGKGIIYTHYGDEDYCIAFTEPGLSSVAVRFQAFEDAAFTMKWATRNGEFSYLHLIDNKMGTDVDCLATDEYRFTASPDDYVSRFKLVFDYTGIGEDMEITPAGTFAFVSGGEMVVNGSGRLEIVDLSGRVIETVDVSGVQSAVAKPALASGIYLLRLTDGDSVKVQKIVLGE